MSAASKHVFDVHKWIEEVIDSCTCDEHTEGARLLLKQYRDLLIRRGYEDMIVESYHSLSHRLCFKENEILDAKFKIT